MESWEVGGNCGKNVILLVGFMLEHQMPQTTVLCATLYATVFKLSNSNLTKIEWGIEEWHFDF